MTRRLALAVLGSEHHVISVYRVPQLLPNMLEIDVNKSLVMYLEDWVDRRPTYIVRKLKSNLLIQTYPDKKCAIFKFYLYKSA